MISPDQLLATIDRVDRQMMALIDDLNDEQLAVPFERGINPPIWEMGHSAFFYEFFLLRSLYGTEPIMPGHDDMWDSFVIPHRERWTPGTVPDKAETLHYYRRVLDETRDHLTSGSSLSDEALYLGQYVVAHQCMHLESLVWCRQTLGFHPPSHLGAEAPGATPQLGAMGDAEIPGQRYRIGVPVQQEGQKADNFSFDNERPGFEMDIASFRISRTLVSLGDFLAFVESGGYEDTRHWSFGGQYWLRQNQLSAPSYWEKKDGEWMIRRFDSLHPLDPALPLLHVNFWEAEAYCHWAKRRLPTEFEWEAAARGPHAHKFPWGTDNALDAPCDLGCRSVGTAPVTAFPESASPFGCLQMIGTAWEWTSSQYLPYDGFSVDMYPYMSTLQFGDHKTCRGGSGATSASLIRSSYRQAFHPDRFDVFTGFRTCALED